MSNIKNELPELVIDRRQWLRGTGNWSSGLLKEGKMCCLGFAAIARGYTKMNIAGRPFTPEGDPNDHWTTSHTLGRGKAAEINDDPTLSDEERESALTELFAKNNCRLSFIG